MKYTVKEEYLNAILEYTNSYGGEIADEITDEGIEWSVYVCGQGARCLDFYLGEITSYYESNGYVEKEQIDALIKLADTMTMADITIKSSSI
jgi:hypothetical protein